jgi:hypothetical protein
VCRRGLTEAGRTDVRVRPEVWLAAVRGEIVRPCAKCRMWRAVCWLSLTFLVVFGLVAFSARGFTCAAKPHCTKIKVDTQTRRNARKSCFDILPDSPFLDAGNMPARHARKLRLDCLIIRSASYSGNDKVCNKRNIMKNVTRFETARYLEFPRFHSLR